MLFEWFKYRSDDMYNHNGSLCSPEDSEYTKYEFTTAKTIELVKPCTYGPFVRITNSVRVYFV